MILLKGFLYFIFIYFLLFCKYSVALLVGDPSTHPDERDLLVTKNLKTLQSFEIIYGFCNIGPRKPLPPTTNGKVNLPNPLSYSYHGFLKVLFI